MKKEIIWAIDTLNLAKKETQVTTICETSYSQVYKILANDNVFYLKINNFLFKNEAKIIQYLYEIAPQNNLQILAANENYNCFITPDMGMPLDQMLKLNVDKELIYKTIDAFQELQNKVDAFQLKSINIRLFETKNIFKLTEGLFLNKLNSTLQIKIKDDIKFLLDSNIKDSLEHGDFHLGNILYLKESQQITFIDLAEATLTNPLFSILSFENTLIYRGNFEEAFINEIKNRYLDDFIQYKKINSTQINKIYTTSKRLWFIYNIWCLEELLKTQCNLIFKIKIEQKIKQNYINLINHYH